MAEQEYRIGIDWSEALRDTEGFIAQVTQLANGFASNIGQPGAATDSDILQSVGNLQTGANAGLARLQATGLFTDAQLAEAKSVADTYLRALRTAAAKVSEGTRFGGTGDVAQSARQSYFGSLGGQQVAAERTLRHDPRAIQAEADRRITQIRTQADVRAKEEEARAQRFAAQARAEDEAAARRRSALFHGTSNRLGFVDDKPRPVGGATSDNNLYGPGFYVTSDPRIAHSYTDKGAPVPFDPAYRPAVFGFQPPKQSKFIDLELPVSDDILGLMEQGLNKALVARRQQIDALDPAERRNSGAESHLADMEHKVADLFSRMRVQGQSIAGGFDGATTFQTLEDLLYTIGRGPSHEGAQAGKKFATEQLLEVNKTLRGAGFSGYRYPGGQATGGSLQHDAYVMFDPSDLQPQGTQDFSLHEVERQLGIQKARLALYRRRDQARLGEPARVGDAPGQPQGDGFVNERMLELQTRELELHPRTQQDFESLPDYLKHFTPARDYDRYRGTGGEYLLPGATRPFHPAGVTDPGELQSEIASLEQDIIPALVAKRDALLAAGAKHGVPTQTFREVARSRQSPGGLENSRAVANFYESAVPATRELQRYMLQQVNATPDVGLTLGQTHYAPGPESAGAAEYLRKVLEQEFARRGEFLDPAMVNRSALAQMESTYAGRGHQLEFDLTPQTQQRAAADEAVRIRAEAEERAAREAEQAVVAIAESTKAEEDAAKAAQRKKAANERAATRAEARASSGGDGGAPPSDVPPGTPTGPDDDDPAAKAAKAVTARLKRAQQAALEAQIYATNPDISIAQTTAGAAGEAGRKLREAQAGAREAEILAGNAPEDKATSGAYKEAVIKAAVNERRLAQEIEQAVALELGANFARKEATGELVKQRNAEAQKLELSKAILSEHEKALKGEHSLITLQAENLAVNKKIVAERRRLAVQQFSDTYGRGGAGRQGTDFVQRAQAYIATRREGELRSADEFQNLKQLFIGKSITTLGFLGPGVLAYGALGQIREALEDAQKLQIALAELEASFDATDQAAEFPNFRAAVLDIAKDTGTAADEVARAGLQIRGSFDDSGQAKDNLRDLQKIVKTTGLDSKEAADQLVAIRGAYQNLSFGDIGDIAFTVQDRFGVAASETIKFLGDIAPAAKEAKFELSDLVAIAGVSGKYGGRGAGAFAEGLSRVLPGIHENLYKFLQVPGLQLDPKSVANSDTKAIFFQIAQQYRTLSDQAQQQVTTLLGSDRQSQFINALFGHPDELLAAAKQKPGIPGRLDDAFERRMQTLGEAVNRLKVALAELGEGLIESGLGQWITDVVDAGGQLIDFFSDLLGLLGRADSLTGGLVTRMGELYFAFKTLQGARAFLGFLGELGIVGAGRGAVAAGAGAGASTGVATGVAQTTGIGYVLQRLAGRRAAVAAAGEGAALTGSAAVRANLFRGFGEVPAAAGGARFFGAGGLTAIGILAADAAVDRIFKESTPKPGERPNVKTGQYFGFGGTGKATSATNRGLAEYYRAIFEQDTNPQLEEIAGRDKEGFFAKPKTRIVENAKIEEARRVLGRRYADSPFTRGLAEDRVLASREAGKLTKKQAEDLLERIKTGDYDVFKELGSEYGGDYAASHPKFKAAFDKRQGQRGLDAASAKAAAEVEEVTGRAIEDTAQSLQLYQAGEISFEEHRATLQGVVSNLQDIKNRGSEDPTLLLELAKAKKDLSQFVSSEIRRTYEFGQKIREAVGQDTPEAGLADALAILRNPDVLPEDKAPVVADALGQIKSRFQTRLSAGKSEFEKARIGRQGVDIPAEVREAALRTQLELPGNADAFRQGADALGVTVESFSNGVIEGYKTYFAGGVALQIKVLQARRNEIAEALRIAIAAGAPEGFIADLLRQQGQVDSAITALEGTQVQDPGTKVTLSPEEQAKADEAARVALQEARDRLRISEAHGDPLQEAKDRKDIANRKLREAKAANDDQRIADAQAEVNGANDNYDQAVADVEQAKLDLLKAKSPNNAVEQARIAQQEASNAIKNAHGEAAKTRAEAQRISADRQMRDAVDAVLVSQIDLAIAVAEANGDVVGAARLRYDEAVHAYERAKAEGAGEAELNALQANVITAQANADRTARNEQEQQILFNFEMKKITRGQAVAALTAILATVKEGTEEYRDLVRTIEGLKKDGNLAFDVPTELNLPTLYEARRIRQSGAAGAAYQDNRNVTITLIANNATDYQGAINKTLEVLSAPSRYGTRPRLLP